MPDQFPSFPISFGPSFPISFPITGGGDPAAEALKRIQSMPGYVAYFDARKGETVLNGSAAPATPGQAVERWNSVDDPSVFFTETTAPPKRTSEGVEPDAAAQIMRGTGFPGTSDARTIVGIYRVTTNTSNNVRLWDADTVNSHNALIAVGSSPTFSWVRGDEIAQDEPVPPINYWGVIVSRKSGSEVSNYGTLSETWAKTAYPGDRSASGMNIFSRGTQGALAGEYAELQGLFFFDATLSDADGAAAAQDAEIVFAKDLGDLDIYALFGQSNAGGQADTTGVTRFDSVDSSQLFMADGPGGYLGFDFGVNQNTGSNSTTSQFGPESELARLLDLNTASDAAICKQAQNGTSLAVDWNPSTGSNYANAKESLSLFIRNAEIQGYTPRVKGLLWVQGERDANNSVATPQATYETLLTDLIADFRATYGAGIPVAISETKVTAAGYDSLADIQAAQAAVAANVSNCSLIDTSGSEFSLQGDGIHFDADGQIELGAAAFSELT